MKRNLAFFIVCLFLCMPAFAQEDDSQPIEQKVLINPTNATRPILPLKMALRTAVAAEMKAVELNMAVAIVILDESQNIKLEYVMDGQTNNALEWARAKALSAFEFKRPTQKGEFKVWTIADQTMVLGVPGGYPLMKGEQVIGAIGISGTRGTEDDLIANAANIEFNKLYNQE